MTIETCRTTTKSHHGCKINKMTNRYTNALHVHAKLLQKVHNTTTNKYDDLRQMMQNFSKWLWRHAKPRQTHSYYEETQNYYYKKKLHCFPSFVYLCSFVGPLHVCAQGPIIYKYYSRNSLLNTQHTHKIIFGLVPSDRVSPTSVSSGVLLWKS